LALKGFSCADIYVSVLVHFKDAICHRKILLKMALYTYSVLLPVVISRKLHATVQQKPSAVGRELR
jgi:hypothetical protein